MDKDDLQRYLQQELRVLDSIVTKLSSVEICNRNILYKDISDIFRDMAKQRDIDKDSDIKDLLDSLDKYANKIIELINSIYIKKLNKEFEIFVNDLYEQIKHKMISNIDISDIIDKNKEKLQILSKEITNLNNLKINIQTGTEAEILYKLFNK